MENNVKQRLIEFIKSKGISIRQFCNTIGASPAFVANIVKSIQPDKIDRIAKHYPELNTGWLLTGEGHMLKPAKNQFSQIPEERIEEIMADTLKEKLIELYNDGIIYPAAVHNRIIAEKDKRIEELQREIWELQKQLKEVGE